MLFGIAAISLPMFVWIEARAKEPILPLELLTQTQPALVFVAFLLLTATWFARVRHFVPMKLILQMYLQPVYLQLVRGVDVLESGVLLIPFSVVSSSVSLYAGWHMRVSFSRVSTSTLRSVLAGVQMVPGNHVDVCLDSSHLDCLLMVALYKLESNHVGALFRGYHWYTVHHPDQYVRDTSPLLTDSAALILAVPVSLMVIR